MMPAVSKQSHIPPTHSGRIIYASPQELPSYPSTGLNEDGAAAGAAASLGWANQKTIEPWKPAASSSASVAAHLANDYKMPAVRETERSSAPYQAATLAAAASARRSPRHEPVSPPSTWGNSAANMAFQAASSSSQGPARNEESIALSHQQSLRGAKGAVTGSRPRSTSTPQKYTYPDKANASSNALNAATVAHRPSAKAKFDETGAVPYTTMSREMYTSRPPVKLEVDEKQHADSLHASAIAMAKRMYTQQQKVIDTAKGKDASTAAARSSSFSRRGGAVSPDSTIEQVTPFPNLQEAAYRLAQERLAKLHDEHQKSRGYQEYYGSPDPQRNAGRLGSIRGKLTRRRSSSDGDLVEDRKRSQQIRQEMSMFNTTLSKIDEEKRTRDRQALLAAAQRNVKAQMKGMDEKLYQDTGRVPPSRLNEWEVKAHSAALLRVESGKNANSGKVDLGGGMFMDQEEVNAIAAKRVQPVIDDINRKAEAERARQVTAKLDEEHRQEELEREKVREKEIQDIHKKLKDQQKEEEKHIKAEAKEAEKARKEQEKAIKADQKRKAKEEKHRSKEASQPVALGSNERAADESHQDEAAPASAALVTPVAPVTADSKTVTSRTGAEPEADSVAKKEENEAKSKQEQVKKEKRKSKFLKKPLALDLRKRVAKEDQEPASAPLDRRQSTDGPSTESAAVKERSRSFSGAKGSPSPPLDEEPRSPGNKIKNWFSSRFSRPRTKSTASAPGADETSASPAANTAVTAAEGGTGTGTGSGFIGGAALRRQTDSDDSSASSLRDVAFASVRRDTSRGQVGLPSTAVTKREESPARSVSSLSTDSSLSEEAVDHDPFVEARAEVVARPLTPPRGPRDPAAVARLSVSPGRGSRFSEIID